MVTKKAPAEREATKTDEPVVIEWREHKFIIPPTAEDWPVTVTQAFEDGKGATATRALLGPDQWAEFMKTHPTNRQLNEIADLIAREYGFDTAGE